jgi:hypothetical protein
MSPKDHADVPGGGPGVGVDRTSAPSCPRRVAAVGLGFYSAVWAMSAVVVSIFHFRDGRQTERWFYPDNTLAWNSIFGG